MELFKLFGTIMVDSSKAEESISSTSEEAESFGDKLKSGIKTATKWAVGVAAAATAVGTAMVAAAKDTAAEMDEIDKGAQRMGVSAEKFQTLQYAASLCGVEMSVVEDATKDLQQAGSDLTFEQAIAQLQNISDEGERSAAAYELFGEKAYQLTPLIDAGAGSMRTMQQEARDLGVVISNDTVASGASMNDMFTKVDESIDTLKSSLMADLMPYVMEILQWIIDNIPMIKETVATVMDTIIPIVEPVINALMDFLPPLLEKIKAFLDWLIPYIDPILSGVFGIVEAIIALINGDTDTFITTIKNSLISLGTALYGIGKDIITALWNGIKEIWTKVSGWVNEKVEWFKGKFQSVKDFLTNDGNGSTVDIQGHHASGLNYVPYDGYIAELHRGESVLSAGNVQSLKNDIISALQGAGGSTGPIELTLNIDGKAFAHATYDAMQYEANRVGGSLVV